MGNQAEISSKLQISALKKVTSKPIDGIWEEPITFKVRVIRGLALLAREIVIHVER